MKLARRLTLVATACACALAALAPAASAVPTPVTYTVNTTLDGVTGCGSPSDTCGLRAAILAADKAGATATIDLPAGTYTLSNLGELLIAPSGPSMTLTIQGAGAGSTIIDADQQSRALEIGSGATVTIQGVTVKNGLAQQPVNASCGGANPLPVAGGGGILDQGTLTLNQDVISGNRALGPGGGIADMSAEGPLTITDTTISGNTTCEGAQPLQADGGGIFTCGCNSTIISDSTISDNGTPAGTQSSGGGIADEGYSPLQITDTTISGNTSTAGGGIFSGLVEGGGDVTLTGDTVSGNTASAPVGVEAPFISGMGGGILNQSDNLSIVNSTIADNTAASGGGIASGAQTDTISFSTIAGNTATGSAPGASGNLESLFGGLFTLDNSIVAGGVHAADPTGGSDNCNGLTASGAFTTAGYNLFDGSGAQCGANTGGVSTDLVVPSAGLGPLADNGGPTQTMALLTGSPAIDAASPTVCATETLGIDQRGVARPQGRACDIGAFEYQSADLALTASASPSSLQVGQSSTITDRITNNGFSTASGVTFTDPSPGGVTIEAATTSQGSCSHSASSVSCTIGSVPVGSSVTVTIVVSATTPGAVTLSSSVTGTLPDPDLANNSAAVPLTITQTPAAPAAPTAISTPAATPVADLAVTRTRPRISVRRGERVSFTLRVTDRGPDADTSVTLVYRVPRGLYWVSSHPSGGVRCTHRDARVRCAIGTLASGGHATVGLVLRSARVGTIGDRATVTGVVSDPNLANNAVQGRVTVTAAACTRDLVFSTSWDPSGLVGTVRVYIDGRLSQTLHGHNLRRVTIKPPPATGIHGVTVAFVIGPYATTTQTRTYRNCAAGPTTYAFPPQTDPGAS